MLVPAQEGKGAGPGSTWHLHTGLRSRWAAACLKDEAGAVSGRPRRKVLSPADEVLAAFHGRVVILLPWNAEASEFKLLSP